MAGPAAVAGRTGRPTREAALRLHGWIIAAATALFLRDGYAATSMEAVAARARVSKRTLYARFPGKPQLFQAVVATLVERWLPVFEAGLRGNEGLAEALLAAARQMLRAALTPEAIALHRLVVAEARRCPEFAGLLANAGTGAGIARVAGLLARAARAGEIVAEDPEWLAEQFQHLVLCGPQSRALGLGAALDDAALADWAERCVTLFLHGLREADPRPCGVARAREDDLRGIV